MTGAGHNGFFWREVLPFAATVVAEITAVGLTIFYKAAVVSGLSYHVFMSYSYAISAVVTLPLAYFAHRKQQLPPFTVGVFFCRFFFLGVLGFMWQACGYKGIELSSPTLASALSNLNPATTFFLAIFLRMEKLNLGRLSSQAKIIGTLVSIGGALVVVLYEGPLVINKHPVLPRLRVSLSSQQLNWIGGGGLLAASFVLLSITDILQARFLKVYPAEFTLVFWYNLSSFIVSVPVGIAMLPDLSAWRVPFGLQLAAILYSGIIGATLSTVLHAWGLHVKGPVYVTMFKPLSIAFAAIMGVIFLGDNLYLGCVVGSLIITMGFYTVMWGKIKEGDHSGNGPQDVLGELPSSSWPSDSKVPLLRHYIIPVQESA